MNGSPITRRLTPIPPRILRFSTDSTLSMVLILDRRHLVGERNLIHSRQGEQDSIRCMVLTLDLRRLEVSPSSDLLPFVLARNGLYSPSCILKSLTKPSDLRVLRFRVVCRERTILIFAVGGVDPVPTPAPVPVAFSAPVPAPASVPPQLTPQPQPQPSPQPLARPQVRFATPVATTAGGDADDTASNSGSLTEASSGTDNEPSTTGSSTSSATA